MLINVIGILYIVFVMKEPKNRTNDDKELVVMLPPETKPPQHDTAVVPPPTANANGNMCTNIVNDCVMVIVRKRSGNGRKIVYLILVIVGLSQALDFGMTTAILR